MVNNKPLIIGIAICIILMIQILVIWLLTFVSEKVGDDKLIFYALIFVGFYIFFPLINVARGKITFKEWLDSRSFSIGFVLITYFIMMNTIIMKVLYTWKPETIWFAPLSLIMMLLAVIFWIKWNYNTTEEKK